MAGRVFWVLGLGVLTAVWGPFVGADDPTQSAQQQFLCPPNGSQTVFYLPGASYPGQIGPTPPVGEALVLDACIKNNGRLTISDQDSTGPHHPRSTLDDGTCFDFLRDRGRLMHEADLYNLVFHWHDTTLVLVSQDGQPQRDCSDAPSLNTVDKTVIPFHDALNPEAIRGLLVIRNQL